MKSWISNDLPGWLRPPGILLRQAKFAVALGCSFALHALLLSSAFSQSQPPGKSAVSKSARAQNSVRDQFKKNSFQVSLQSDLERPAPAAAEVESATGVPSPDIAGADGKVVTNGQSEISVERVAPAMPEPMVPLIPAIVYYRPDELDKRPEITRQIEPEFPAAVNPGTRGTVTARLFISEEGWVEQVAILAAQPPGLFEEAVSKAFEGARFTPGMRGGKAVRTQLTLAIDFASEVAR